MNKNRLCVCSNCKHANKNEMKCYPNSKDCRKEYDLEETDFYELKPCDFYEEKIEVFV